MGVNSWPSPPDAVSTASLWPQVLQTWGETGVRCVLVLSHINMIYLIFECQKKMYKPQAWLAIAVVSWTLRN